MGKNKYKKTKLENTIIEIYPPSYYILSITISFVFSKFNDNNLLPEHYSGSLSIIFYKNNLAVLYSYQKHIFYGLIQ